MTDDMMNLDIMGKGAAVSTSKSPTESKIATIEVHRIRKEYEGIVEKLEELNKRLLEKNEEVLRLKQSALISTGAKLCLEQILEASEKAI